MKAEAAASSEAPSNDSTTAEGASQGESTGLITPQKAAATPRAATPLLSNTKLASERIKHLEQSLQAAQQEVCGVPFPGRTRRTHTVYIFIYIFLALQLDLMRARQKLFTPKAILERTETKLGEIEKELLEKTEQLKTVCSGMLRPLNTFLIGFSPPFTAMQTEALLEKTEKERDFLQTRVSKVLGFLRLSSWVHCVLQQVGRGDFNSSTTKVLHLVMNPTRRALELKAEKVRITFRTRFTGFRQYCQQLLFLRCFLHRKSKWKSKFSPFRLKLCSWNSWRVKETQAKGQWAMPFKRQ